MCQNNADEIRCVEREAQRERVCVQEEHRVPGPAAPTFDTTLPRPKASHELSNKFPELARIYELVRTTRIPNYHGARIPLSHGLNIGAWRASQEKFTDHQLVDFLDFGFPTGFIGTNIPTFNLSNHSFGAMAGPFHISPFNEWFRVNPMLTRPKSDSNKLCVMLDLVFP